MPLGKYICDYCEKEFQDTPSARRRHLLGIQHQRAKALWFDSFKNPSQVHSQGFGIGVCNRFIRTGFCQYGDSCKYFHPMQNVQNTIGQGNVQDPVFLGNQVVGGGSLPGGVVRDNMGVSWGNLPASLQPPPEGGYPPLPFIDWG